MSDSDEDIYAIAPTRQLQPQLFLNDDDDDASSSPPRAPVLKTKRAAPRFLGDGAASEAGTSHHDLFADLDDLPDHVDVPSPTRAGAKAKTRPAAPGAGEFDRLFNAAIAGMGDADNLFGGTGLGDGGEVDEVKKKARKPRAKMDDARLLGPTGFPKLMQSVRKFKPTGKGSEVKDLQRVMSLYQLWAHQMFPKTNLRDTLVVVEKLCHKRSVQRALKDYREEIRTGRAPKSLEDPSTGKNVVDTTSDDSGGLAAPRQSAAGLAPQLKNPSQGANNLDDPFGDFDEDAMLAEMEMEAPVRPAIKTSTGKEREKAVPAPRDEREDEFDEDEAMLAEFEREEAESNESTALSRRASTTTSAAADEEEFDEMDAIMAEMEQEESRRNKDSEGGLPEESAPSPVAPLPQTPPAPARPSAASSAKDPDFDGEIGDDVELDADVEAMLATMEGSTVAPVRDAATMPLDPVVVLEDDDAQLAAAEDAILAELGM